MMQKQPCRHLPKCPRQPSSFNPFPVDDDSGDGLGYGLATPWQRRGIQSGQCSITHYIDLRNLDLMYPFILLDIFLNITGSRLDPDRMPGGGNGGSYLYESGPNNDFGGRQNSNGLYGADARNNGI